MKLIGPITRLDHFADIGMIPVNANKIAPVGTDAPNTALATRQIVQNALA